MSDTDLRPGAVESREGARADGDPLLLQLRSDRRLGHEWDDWDGAPLPNDGVFDIGISGFYRVAALLGIVWEAGAFVIVWAVAPRLMGISNWVVPALYGTVLAVVLLWFLWVVSIGLVLRRGQNWLPPRLAERGLLPWVMPFLERSGRYIGLGRDRCGNALMRVYNGLAAARHRDGYRPSELLILLPRCLGKEAMQAAMRLSQRYGVPLFVAARGRYARQMIAMRQPRGVIAVACERDLVSGVHDVAGRLPVLGTTLQLADGPCRNTAFAEDQLENQIRVMLGLEAGGSSRAPTVPSG